MGSHPISYTLYFRLYQYFVLPINVLKSIPARILHAVNITGCKNLGQKVFTVWDEHDGKCVGSRKVTQNKTK